MTASIEEITTYNMLLTEAIYEVLADKGIYIEGRGSRASPKAQGGDDCELSTVSMKQRRQRSPERGMRPDRPSE